MKLYSVLHKMSKQIPIFTVDAFSPRPFGGNPAAVCLLEEDISDELKQKIAMEMNISETAFVLPMEKTDQNPFKNGAKFELRWFTPTTEVPLCGHATLASAATLFYTQFNDNTIEFQTRQSGVLTCYKSQSMTNGVEMKLPINDPNINLDKPTSSESIWKLIKVFFRNNPKLIPHQVRLSPTTKKLLIRLQDGTTRQDLEDLKVDKEAVLKIDTSDQVRGVIVTLNGQGTQYDFISRYFAPWVGIPEDPVTGSAHTVLTPYWAQELNGKNKLFARQSSPRGGELELELKSDHIKIKGQGTVVLRGSIAI